MMMRRDAQTAVLRWGMFLIFGSGVPGREYPNANLEYLKSRVLVFGFVVSAFQSRQVRNARFVLQRTEWIK